MSEFYVADAFVILTIELVGNRRRRFRGATSPRRVERRDVKAPAMWTVTSSTSIEGRIASISDR